MFEEAGVDKGQAFLQFLVELEIKSNGGSSIHIDCANVPPACDSRVWFKVVQGKMFLAFKLGAFCSIKSDKISRESIC